MIVSTDGPGEALPFENEGRPLLPSRPRQVFSCYFDGADCAAVACRHFWSLLSPGFYESTGDELDNYYHPLTDPRSGLTTTSDVSMRGTRIELCSSSDRPISSAAMHLVENIERITPSDFERWLDAVDGILRPGGEA